MAEVKKKNRRDVRSLHKTFFATVAGAALVAVVVLFPLLIRHSELNKSYRSVETVKLTLVQLSSLARKTSSFHESPAAIKDWNQTYKRGLALFSGLGDLNLPDIQKLQQQYESVNDARGAKASDPDKKGYHDLGHGKIDKTLGTAITLSRDIMKKISNIMLGIISTSVLILSILTGGIIATLLNIYRSLIGPLRQISANIKNSENNSDELFNHPDYLPELSDLVTCYNRQVNNYRLANKILKEKKKLLETANAAQANFFINLSHEIRTPLNGINGFIELLRSEELPATIKDYFHNITESCEMLLAIVNDTMDMSKLGSGKYILNNSVCSFPDIIRECHLLLINSLSEHNISYSQDLPDEGVLPVYTDGLRVKQIIINLMTNAIKYTRSGGCVTITLRQKALPDNRCLNTLVVSDNGIGIRSENIGKIFEPFVQGEAFSESRYGGTGLGLSICKKIAEVLEGELRVNSKYGQGSAFTFEFPCKQASPSQTTSDKSSAPTTDFRKDLRIMIVEDNLINQKVLKKMLKKSGQNYIDVVTNPLDSFDLVKENNYDVIFMDLKMPEMDGITTAKKIQDILGKSTPIIIAVTANSFEEEKNLCLQSGFSAYLTKPVKMISIAAELARYFPLQDEKSKKLS